MGWIVVTIAPWLDESDSQWSPTPVRGNGELWVGIEIARLARSDVKAKKTAFDGEKKEKKESARLA